MVYSQGTKPFPYTRSWSQGGMSRARSWVRINLAPTGLGWYGPMSACVICPLGSTTHGRMALSPSTGFQILYFLAPFTRSVINPDLWPMASIHPQPWLSLRVKTLNNHPITNNLTLPIRRRMINSTSAWDRIVSNIRRAWQYISVELHKCDGQFDWLSYRSIDWLTEWLDRVLHPYGQDKTVQNSHTFQAPFPDFSRPHRYENDKTRMCW